MGDQLTTKGKAKRLLDDRFFRIFPDLPERYPVERLQQLGFRPSPMKLVLFKSGETHSCILEDGCWTKPIPTQNDELVIEAIWELEVSALPKFRQEDV